jgi:SRP-independent targeting protein 2/TMEM208
MPNYNVSLRCALQVDGSLCLNHFQQSHTICRHFFVEKQTALDSAVAFYRPLLLLTNCAYWLIRWRRHGLLAISLLGGVGVASTMALQYYAYVGILDNAAATTGHRSVVGDQSLVGGSSLDLLALTWLVQFGSVLVSGRFYWLLAVVPPWGAYALYQTLFRTGSGGPPTASTTTPSTANHGAEASGAQSERRQHRAEKRRQKWS